MSLPAQDQILHVDLKSRDPDEAFTVVPYEKGSLFLRWLEEKFGRDRFDKFLRDYFDTHAFTSITTEAFLDYLRRNLIEGSSVSRTEIEEWIEKPGLPKDAPSPYSENFAKVEDLARSFLKEEITAQQIDARNWATQEWLRFLKAMLDSIDVEKMTELDKKFNLTNIGNSEIAFQWLIMSIRSSYKPAWNRLREFLKTVGRRKFVRPLYAELSKTPEGMHFAKKVYSEARESYHPITQASIDAILKP